MTELTQHQVEIERNLRAWQNKRLLQKIYAGFYRRIIEFIDPHVPGAVVEIGSGIGNLKEHLPGALCTDLFPNPWLDLVCDGYELPFRDESLSHLILFDVFHHLQAPKAFFKEAQRVLHPAGRLIIFEPYISWLSYPVFGCLHHEPVAWRATINFEEHLDRPRRYYAAQGNATRLFFTGEPESWLPDWVICDRQVFSSFSYLLSGGFSKPSFYPESWLPGLLQVDATLSKWPRLFGARCLVGLRPRKTGGNGT